MVFGKIFKGLFGKSEPPILMSDQPFGPKPGAAEISTPSPVLEPELQIVVCRDEIIGERARLLGYRFQARVPGSRAPVAPNALLRALQADRIQAIAQRRTALVPISADDWLAAPFHEIAAPGLIFLVRMPADETGGERYLETLAQIKQAGARLAIESIAIDRSPAAALADLVLIDFHAYSLEAFERLVKRIKSAFPAVQIAVDGVHGWTEHRLCQALGTSFSLGGFAASPDEEVKGEQLNQSRLILIEMLNMLRQQADLAEIALVAKRDPGVTVKLIDMANSPLSGLSSPVASINQAMMLLGRDMLYRWLSLGIYRAGTGEGRDETLLEIALTRARFLEHVAHEVRSKHECEELFLVGMMSLLDSLLGMPMAKVLEKITLPTVVSDVLLRSEGPYGKFLMLVMLLEKANSEAAARIAQELGIPMSRIEEANAEALAWTAEALSATS